MLIFLLLENVNSLEARRLGNDVGQFFTVLQFTPVTVEKLKILQIIAHLKWGSLDCL